MFGVILALLLSEVNLEDRTAIETFYGQFEQLPIVEVVNEQECDVTFLYRAPDAKRVMLMGGLVDDPVEHQLIRLGESDIWYKTYRIPKDLRLTYWFSVDGPEVSVKEKNLAEIKKIFDESKSTWSHDRCNPDVFSFGEEQFSVLELPDAPKAVWCAEREVPKGKIEFHTITSVRLQNERTVGVYTPPGEGTDYPLLIVFDGRAYTSFVPTPTILDNLIAEGKIPPVVALFVGNVNRDVELPCSPSFAYFVADELVPWAQSIYPVSKERDKTIVAGSSYGGLAATYLALRFPEVFGKVLSQSGAYWWGYDEPEWLTEQVDLAPGEKLALYLDVGSLENMRLANGPSTLEANRRMQKALEKSGHKVVYREVPGGHEYISWRVTFADGLVSLLSGS